MSQIIYVKKQNKNAILKMYDNYKKIIDTPAFIGKNGMTKLKKEGDNKTPIGEFELGITFGTHDIKVSEEIKYIKINKNLYWVDDINSTYYNKLVDITKVDKKWISAEHLTNYPIEYEYGIEIKTNPNNIIGNGSAIFIHCENNKPTAGCVAIDRLEMTKLLINLKKNCKIKIQD